MPAAQHCFLKLRFPLVRDVQKPRHSTIDTIALRIRVLMADTGGSIAIQFAVLALVMIALAGGAIDTANVMRVRDTLNEAADAAAIGAITKSSLAFNAANTMTGDGIIPAGAGEMTNIFNANSTGATKNVTGLTANPTVTKTGKILTAQMQWTASVPLSFLGLMGQTSWQISGTSVATTALPRYIDFYLMVDVSGSMGIPSTNSDMQRLAKINTDMDGNCMFACHYNGAQGYSNLVGYTYSRNGGNSANPQVKMCPQPGLSYCIQLRTDALSIAIQQLLNTAQQSETIQKQFRIGLYPFISFLESYFPLTDNITATGTGSLSNAVNNISTLLDTGQDPVLGSGGTHFENALPAMSSQVKVVGDGSYGNPKPFVFLVTDGMENTQYINYPIGAWWTGSNPSAIDATLCNAIKQRGIIISILYTPYLPITGTSSTGWESTAANNAIGYIPGNLKSCASPGYFYTANTPQDITSALNSMFLQALGTAARISQ